MTEKPTYEELEQRIKELEQAEIELKRSEELFRGLFANMTSGSAIYEVVNDGLKGSDYIVKGFNNKSLEIEGKTLEQVVGKTLFDLRPNIDDYGLIPAMKKVWETGLSAYYPVKLYKDNNFSNYYENYIFKIPSGEIVTIYSDITERKRIEGALRESERKHRLIADNSGDVIFTLDMNLCYTYVSLAVYKMRGFYPEEVMNNRISETLTPESLERVSLLIAEQLKIQEKEGYKPIAIELEMLCKDGGTVWAEVGVCLDMGKNPTILLN